MPFPWSLARPNACSSECLLARLICHICHIRQVCHIGSVLHIRLVCHIEQVCHIRYVCHISSVLHIRPICHIGQVGFYVRVYTHIYTCMILSLVLCFTWNIYIVPYNCIYNCIWFWFEIFLRWDEIFLLLLSLYIYNCTMLFIPIFSLFCC